VRGHLPENAGSVVSRGDVVLAGETTSRWPDVPPTLQLAQGSAGAADHPQTAQTLATTRDKKPATTKAAQPPTLGAEPAQSEDRVKTILRAAFELAEAGRKELEDVKGRMKAIEERLDANSKTLEGMKKDLNGQAMRDAIVKDISRTMADAIGLMQKEIDRVDQQFFGLARNIDVLRREVTRREARHEDVALVIFHSKRLDGKLFTATLREIFLQDNYRLSFANYRLGLYVAANGKIEANEVNLQPDPQHPVLPANLEFQPPDPVSTELTQALEPKDIFPPTAVPTRRRMVIVASSDAEPPKPGEPKWDGIQCYAILIDQTGKLEEGKSEAWKKWRAFCRKEAKGKANPALMGEAALISFARTEKQPLPDAAQTEFDRVLRWYIRPLR
jgi:flagellar motility protein MotE (MotC chaperone)